MKATLEFEDGFEFRRAIEGRDTHALLWQLDQEMRACVKYNGFPHDQNENFPSEEQSVIDDTTNYWRGRIWKLAGKYHVDLEDDYDF